MDKKFKIIEAGEAQALEIHTLLSFELMHDENGFISTAFYEKNRHQSWHPDKLTPTIIEASKNPKSKQRCWVAYTEENFAIGIITTKNLSGGVYVLPEYQKQGIGTALLKTRIDYMRDNYDKGTIMQAHIMANNENSLNVHFKLGFSFNKESQKIIEDHKAKNIPRQDIKDQGGLPKLFVLEKKL